MTHSRRIDSQEEQSYYPKKHFKQLSKAYRPIRKFRTLNYITENGVQHGIENSWRELLREHLRNEGGSTSNINIPRFLVTKEEAELVREFYKHLERWRQEVSFISSMSQIIAHPDYKSIIDMGTEVVPLLLLELEAEPDYLFAALRAITGENPVSKNIAGDLDKMAEVWIEWGREKQLI